MARNCSICSHPKHEVINQSLVAGATLRSIAGQQNVSKTSLSRHQRDHLPTALTMAKDAAEVAQADTLLEQVQSLQTKALHILQTAEEAGQLRAALAAIREARGCLELLAKLSGELDTQPQVNVLLAPEWVSLRATILLALEPYPTAREAILVSLNDYTA